MPRAQGESRSAPASATPSAATDVGGLSFEQALAELEGIVKRLEEGQGQLEEAIVAYDRGIRLKQHCEAKLKDAKARIERIVQGSDGAPAVKPMDAG
ncbi:MAG: exodeoxyribonuclease VII small subunit [Alphaproteobacteria bacterium]|nr:exodeoxyribonuclease VII small subunit [Alphaproteobacteria bacterium]